MEVKLPAGVCVLLILVDLTTGLIYGEQSGQVALKPTVTGSFAEILWKHNGDKAVEFFASSGPQEFGQFVGRTSLNTQTGELIIRNLEKTHSGRYKAEALVAGRLQYSDIDVKVIDAVTQPRVECEQKSHTGILRCQSEGDEAQYRWEGPNDLLMNWTHQPIELEIGRDQSSDSAYTCVVKNPVSEERSEAFPAERCFKGQSTLIWALVATIVVIVLIVALSVLIIWVCCMHRRRSSEAPDQVVPSRAEEENEGQALLQNHNERITGSCEDSPSEDDRNTAERVDSPAETIETHGEKERGEKQANGAPAKPESGSQSQSVDGNEMQEAGTSGAHGGEREGGKGQQEEQGNGAEDPEKKPAMARSGSGSGSCSQKTSEDGDKTVGHIDSAAETHEKQGENMMEVEEKVEAGGSEAAIEEWRSKGSPQNPDLSESSTNKRKEDPETRANEKEGAANMDVEEEQETRAAGESGTNRQPTGNEDLEQNDTRTGTDVTQSSGDTDGETQHGDTVPVPGGEDAAEEKHKKTEDAPGDEDVSRRYVSDMKKRFERSPDNAKHESGRSTRKDENSVTGGGGGEGRRQGSRRQSGEEAS